MTVYVDDIRIPARVGGLYSRWSHLIADTPEELHEFAERLGARAEWHQEPVAEPGTRQAEDWHYVLPDRVRIKAVKLGAVPVSLEDLVGIIEARWKLKKDAHAAYWAHREGCWYTGNPAEPLGRGCSEHNRLYDGWQAALRGEL